MRVAQALAPLPFAEPKAILALPGETIRSIEARQHYRLPVVAVRNGEPVLRRDWDSALTDEDELIFIVYPAGGEGGVKNILRTVLNIALVLTATYFLGPAGAGLTGWELGAAVAATQIASSYLINAILPPQPVGAGGAINYESASPTYSLQAQGNQARLLQPIPKLYGRHILTPDFAEAPYTEYAGNDQYLYQLFSLGLGSYDVESILIEDTELWNNVDGLTGTFPDVEIELVEPGAAVSIFPSRVITSVEVGGQTLKGPNDGGDWVGPYVANSAGTRARYLAIDLVWPSGAFYAKDDGSLGPTTTSVMAEARLVDDAGDPDGDWFTLFNESYIFSTRTPQRVSERIQVALGRYEVRVKRGNNSALDGDTRTFDAVTWQAMRAYLPGESIYPKETVLAMRAKATDQLSSQSARRVRTVQTSKLPLWDGANWTAPQATRDIWPIVADMMRNEDYGKGASDSRLAFDDFVSLHATWQANGDRFDGVFDEKKPLMQAIADVLRVGRAQPVLVGKMLTAVRDEKRDVPRAIFTPRNVVRGSLQVDYVFVDEDTPDDVIVEFFDARTWKYNEVQATLPDSTSEKPARISLFGCTDRTRAWKHGIYQAAVNRYRRRLPTMTTELDGRLLRRGDMVLLAHPLPKWGRAYEVVGFDEGNRLLTLSDPVALSETETNFLRLQKPDGSVWGPVIVTSGSIGEELIADEVDLTGVIAEQGDWADFITFDGTQEPTVAAVGYGKRVPRECLLASAQPQGGNRVQLSLVVDNDAVYTADAGDPPDETEVISLPTVPKKPAIYVIDVEVGGTRYAPELHASWQPADGADRTTVRISYDHVTWNPVQDSALNSWSGRVEATTVWIEFRPIGAVAGDPVERYFDLSITEAPPAQVQGVSVTEFAQQAWVDFSLPDEEGISGVIAKVGAQGFDPETEGTVVYSGPVVTRITMPLDSDTVYARVAAFNVFGATGLNWSSELAISPNALTKNEFSQAVVDALGNAEAMDGGFIWRIDANGRLAGGSIVSGGESGQEIIAGFLVDAFQIAHPDVNGGDPISVFTVTDGVVSMNAAIVNSLTAAELKAAWAQVDILVGGRIVDNEADPHFDINLAAGYWTILR